MSAYIATSGVATTLSLLLQSEIDANATSVLNYTHDWTPVDMRNVQPLLAAEKNAIQSAVSLGAKNDSVKGESAMQIAYATRLQQKAVDVITQKGSGSLALIELKYLIKFASMGPFGGRGSFKTRIADKFCSVSNMMEPDGESLDPLRILVVTEEQYPYSVNHVRALLDGEYPVGTFSSDGKSHDYVLCTSVKLRTLLDNPPSKDPSINQYLFSPSN